MRILLHSPKDTVAGLLAFAAVSAILANALFLQTGHHPAPMFGSVVVMPQPGSAAANLFKATAAPPAAPSNALRPPAPIPASSHAELSGPRRVAAVQRTLTEYGY